MEKISRYEREDGVSITSRSAIYPDSSEGIEQGISNPWVESSSLSRGAKTKFVYVYLKLNSNQICDII